MLRMVRVFTGPQRLGHRILRPRREIRAFASTAFQRSPPHIAAVPQEKLPALWVRKMKTVFAFVDRTGDGMITQEDFQTTPQKVTASVGMTEEARVKFDSTYLAWWMHLSQGKAPSDYQISESMFIDSALQMMSAPDSEAQIEDLYLKFFSLFDIDNDGAFAKQDIIRTFEATSLGGIAGLVAFTVMDTNHDGKVTCDEFVATAKEFYFNFVDETKASNYFFGPLKEL